MNPSSFERLYFSKENFLYSGFIIRISPLSNISVLFHGFKITPLISGTVSAASNSLSISTRNVDFTLSAPFISLQCFILSIHKYFSAYNSTLYFSNSTWMLFSFPILPFHCYDSKIWFILLLFLSFLSNLFIWNFFFLLFIFTCVTLHLHQISGMIFSLYFNAHRNP